MNKKNKWIAREEELQRQYPQMDKREIENIVEQEWYESLCPEDKAMIDREARRRVRAGYVVLLALCAAAAWIGIKTYQNQKSVSYVVTDKEGQKVVCVEEKNPANIHIVEFGAFPRDSLFYRNIRVGDKLSVENGGLKSPVEPLTDKLGRQNIVMDVNGKTFREIKKVDKLNAQSARRDSLINEIKAKQR